MEELGANYAAGVDKLTCNQQNCAQTKTKTLETRLHLPPYSRNELCSSIRSNFVRKKFFHNHRSKIAEGVRMMSHYSLYKTNEV